MSEWGNIWYNRTITLLVLIFSVAMMSVLWHIATLKNESVNSTIFLILGVVGIMSLLLLGGVVHRLRQNSMALEKHIASQTNELKQANAELLISQQYMDNIFQSMLNTLIVVNPDTTIKLVNQATLNLLGYTEEELIGKPVEQVIPEKKLPLFNEAVEEDELVKEVETLYLTKEGKRIPMLFSGSIMCGKDESIQGVVCVAQDITRHKAAEAALKESESRLSGIVETALEGIVTIDQKGFIESYNPAAEKIFGYQAEEVIGKNASVLMPISEKKQGGSQIERYIKIGKKFIGQTREVVGRKKDGTRLFLELSLSEVEFGNKKGFTGILHDITERKQADIQLQKWEYVFHFAGWGISISIADQPYLDLANPHYHKMLGYEPGELLGIHIEELYIPEERPKIIEYVKKIHELGHYSFESRMLKKNGDILPVVLDVSAPKDHRGRVLYRVANVRDITERKQAELALKLRNDELLVANKKLKDTQMQLIQSAKLASLGEMATGIAHELNQPLFAISLETEDTIEDIEQNAYGQALPRLEKILKMVDRASRIINHLRTFGRDSGASQFAIADINAIIQEAFTLLQKQLSNRDIEVVRELYEDKLLVRCEPLQIEQILTNLFTNARDAMEHTMTKRLIVRSYLQGDWVVVDVEDTGMGIPETNLPQIFDPFFTTKEVGKGTGLGLSISHGIIANHGGNLKVASTSECGTQFQLLLPSYTKKEQS